MERPAEQSCCARYHIICGRQPKNIVFGAYCRQLNVIILSCRRLAVSLVMN